jgi:hypothetical protein
MAESARHAWLDSGTCAVPADGVVRAVVVHGSIATPYSRAGCGAPLLLLVGEEGVADALLRVLAVRFRVIVPRLPAPPATTRDAPDRQRPPPVAWLVGVLDGLGLQRFSVAADGCWREALLDLAVQEPGRIDRIVLLRSDVSDAVVPEPCVPGGDTPRNLPSLLSGIDVSADPPLLPATLARITRFLAGEPDRAPG